MLTGRIININSTKYLVSVDDKIYDCTLRGIFRKEKITPLVGDYVEDNEKDAQIVKILPRQNSLLRPNIANVDIALIITSVKKPDLDLVLLDKLLTMVSAYNINPLICFTKVDLLSKEEKVEFNKIKDYYIGCGYLVITNDEEKKFEKLVKNKVVVACGQTGAGKSTFINKIDKTLNLETKPISDFLNRGVHTTRYVSLYKVKDYYIADTPGFSALDLSTLSLEQIKWSFKEFDNNACKYRDCNHINTEGCEVIKAIGKKILQSRYDNYLKFVEESNENSSKFFKKR